MTIIPKGYPAFLVMLLLVCTVLFVSCSTDNRSDGSPTVSSSPTPSPATPASAAQACEDIMTFDDPDPSLNATDTTFTCQGELALIVQPKANPSTALLGYGKADCGKTNAIELDFNAKFWGVVFAKTCPGDDVIVLFEISSLPHALAFLGHNSFSINFDTTTPRQKFRGNFDSNTLSTYSIMPIQG